MMAAAHHVRSADGRQFEEAKRPVAVLGQDFRWLARRLDVGNPPTTISDSSELTEHRRGLQGRDDGGRVTHRGGILTPPPDRIGQATAGNGRARDRSRQRACASSNAF